MAKALYLLKNRHLRDPEWRAKLKDYRFVVSVMSLDLDDAHSIAPQTTFAAYLESVSIPHYGLDTSIYGEQRRAMQEFYLRDALGDPIRNRFQNYELQLTFAAFDRYANWFAENLPAWPALYIDSAWGTPPHHWLESTGHDVTETLARWPAIRDYFVRRLNDLMPDVTIVGNTAMGPRPVGLDAITLESDGVGAKRRAVALAKFRNRPHEFNVLWRPKGGRPPLMDLSKFGRFVCDGHWTPEMSGGGT